MGAGLVFQSANPSSESLVFHVATGSCPGCSFIIQLSVYGLRKQRGWKSLVSCTHWEDLEEAPSVRLRIASAVVSEGIWGVNQQMVYCANGFLFSVPFSLCKSASKEKINFLKRNWFEGDIRLNKEKKTSQHNP